MTDAKTTMTDAKNTITDAKTTITDAKSTTADTKNTITDTKNTITDADAKRKRRQQAYARRLVKKKRAAAMHDYTVDDIYELYIQKQAKETQKARKKKRRYDLTMETSQSSDNLKQPADNNNASSVNNDSPSNEERSDYGVDLSDKIYNISPVDKHGCRDYFF